MSIIKQHMISLFEKGVRQDGRKFDEIRDVSIEYGVSSKSAEGSAKVKIGETEVIAGIKLDIGEPFPDSLDQGTITVNAELLPLASPDFEAGPPGVDAVELSRVVDRAIRESKMLDFHKLCIKEGEKVWLVFIDIYPLNDDGNLFDAAALASIAALKDARFPSFDGEKIDYKTRTNKSLPLNDFALSCTIRKTKNVIFVDPDLQEDKLSDARLTVAFTKKGDLCALQKGGDSALLAEETIQMIDLAKKTTLKYRKVLEK